MENEGISDGDYVIVEASANYQPTSEEMIVTRYLPPEAEPDEEDLELGIADTSPLSSQYDVTKALIS